MIAPSSTAVTADQLDHLRRLWWRWWRASHPLPPEPGVIVMGSS